MSPLPIALAAYSDFPCCMQPSVKFTLTLCFDCLSHKNYPITKILHRK